MNPFHGRRVSPGFAALALFCGLAGRAEADQVYLALGDSVTFGIDSSTPSAQLPSYGDQGFVRPFADFLGSMNGGVRPTVLNLAIPGELSTSFFSGDAPPGWTQRVPQLNLNDTDVTTPQNDLMMTSINAIHAAGNTVGTASFLIGANDIFYLVGSPAFLAASAADQQAMVGAVLGTVQANYVHVLTELTTLAPEAKVLLPGYYDPFPASSPTRPLYESIIGIFNATISADAALFRATDVDLHTPFLDRELELTNIATGDVHPNQAGYAVIGTAFAHAVPEPASMALLGLGGTGLVAMLRRRKATA